MVCFCRVGLGSDVRKVGGESGFEGRVFEKVFFEVYVEGGITGDRVRGSEVRSFNLSFLLFG